jgi:hypothetical protein
MAIMGKRKIKNSIKAYFKQIKHYKVDVIIIFCLFLTTFLIRIPLYHTDFWKTTDSIEYINVANQINSGHGFTQSIKWHFFTNSPVVTSAFEGKPFLSSLFFAPVLFIFKNVYSLQLFLFSIVASSVAILYVLSRQYLSRFFSILLALLFALNTNILINNRLILSEPIFYFFVLCALLVYKLRLSDIMKYSMIGCFSALSYMTRNEGLLILLVFLAFSRKKIKNVIITLVAFLFIASPYLVLNYLNNGSLFYSYNINHFRVHHFLEGMGAGYGKIFPTPIEFIINNIHWIISEIVKLFFLYLKALAGFGFLGLLTISLIFLFKREVLSKFKMYLVIALLIIINYSIFWSAFSVPDRHIALSFILLLFPIGYIIQSVNHKKQIFLLVLVFLTIIIYTVYDIHRIHWAKNIEPFTEIWRVTEKHNLYAFINNHTDKNAIIASPNPAMIYLYTQRPSLLLPYNINDKNIFEKFIKEYNVSYLITEKTLQFKSNQIHKVQTLSGVYIYSIYVR